MQLAKVVGNVVATCKDPNLIGQKLLLVQPLDPDRKSVGRILVAVDSVGAGPGEEVFVVRGREASVPFLPDPVLPQPDPPLQQLPKPQQQKPQQQQEIQQ